MLRESPTALAAGMARYYRGLFLAAAGWNLLSGGVVLRLWTDAKFRMTMQFPGSADAMSLQLLATCLFVFGLGYYWVSGELSRNRDLVKLGAIGKPLVFLVFFGHALAKEIPMALVVPSMMDLLFGALFLEFLVRTCQKAQ